MALLSTLELSVPSLRAAIHPFRDFYLSGAGNRRQHRPSPPQNEQSNQLNPPAYQTSFGTIRLIKPVSPAHVASRRHLGYGTLTTKILGWVEYSCDQAH